MNTNFIIFRSGQKDEFGLDITGVVMCELKDTSVTLSSGKKVKLTPEEFDDVIKVKKGQFK